MQLLKPQEPSLNLVLSLLLKGGGNCMRNPVSIIRVSLVVYYLQEVRDGERGGSLFSGQHQKRQTERPIFPSLAWGRMTHNSQAWCIPPPLSQPS